MNTKYMVTVLIYHVHEEEWHRITAKATTIWAGFSSAAIQQSSRVSYLFVNKFRYFLAQSIDKSQNHFVIRKILLLFHFMLKVAAFFANAIPLSFAHLRQHNCLHH